MFQKSNLRIYAKGVLYNQEFYSFNQLKDFLLVKNYRGGYEYYRKKKKKILTLFEHEMEYLS